METPSNRPERESPAAAAAASGSGVGNAPLTPRSADPNSYPTTFVQADTSSFKQVVQMLTGTAETAAAAAASSPGKNLIPPAGKPNGPKKPAFKLYERRGSLKNLKAISPLIAGGGCCAAVFSPRKQTEILSPSMLDFPSLVLSPVTPLIPDPFNRSPPPPPAGSAAAVTAEDRAIAEKGYYLHPSPRSDLEPPRLLHLFPESSPRFSSSSLSQ
ncbi:VQ motif-containing protein 4-like [Phalaenopsis equestris]|uniref:VQ motif-containing protein 4-like n=1 Tax=Phalaenopsis equestris TaxID=78828 RepID=UPI0009E5507C|nr:VQ motif-containing protein 4-like [Phalaenopsis equestris]